jgi:serine/threonine protein kinase/tetratricopeptide (TPR) repeat protein
MKAERWQQVERLYHAALERGAEGRAAFLDEACAGDEGLRSEVQSLLSYEGQAENFIESPALELAAKVMAEGQGATALVGQTINQYRVTSRLGMGGMGEVYLAEDTRLGRSVALKFLPALFTQDKGHLRRFEQEARAVAALSHPNVCTIHEVIETAEGRHCIVMEYVDGVTLRGRMAEGPMKVGEAIDVSIQVASALAAAHAAGIVHRDIKPENIMIRRDGYVKVLDFGLAKLTEPGLKLDTEAATKMSHTSPGMVIGTVSYMSPEQARGLPVEAGTDVWSLGVVLYEMVAGQRPFEGETPTDVIILIAGREPPPLSMSASEAPTQLERILSKALAKDRAERYSTAEDLLPDLKSLRRELEIGAEVQRYTQTGPSAKYPDTARNRQTITSRFEWTQKRIPFFAAIVGTLIVAGLVAARFFRQSPPTVAGTEIKSLAVLPLKSLNREAGNDYLGLGIADTIITKVSQVGELTVRPTSAVSKYADQEIDSLEAARQLQADAVLDGTFLHAGDRLRVSVNLLRVRDGASLWAESFDMSFTDIFAIQDKVSQEVAARLRNKLSPAEQARLAKRHTANPEAYSYYTKAMYHFSKRGFSGDSQEETYAAIDLFKKAIELDSSYALPHAQLGYAYAWIADFKEAANLIASAKEELRAAERLDPQLAEVHVARSFIFWSHYEDWQIETAIREARLAKQLDPSIHNHVLGVLYYHVGLEEQAAKEFEWALEQDPTSDVVKRGYVTRLRNFARPDEWLALNQRLFNRGPDVRYYLEKRMLDKAAPLVEQEYVENPDEPATRRDKALLLALQGKHREAQAAVPRIMEKVRRNKGYHHFTYDIARIYALDGKGEEALKWLRTTVKEGFPCYTLFARDPFLDPIRKDSAFIQFMAEMKTRWEGYQREFG